MFIIISKNSKNILYKEKYQQRCNFIQSILRDPFHTQVQNIYNLSFFLPLLPPSPTPTALMQFYKCAHKRNCNLKGVELYIYFGTWSSCVCQISTKSD